MSYLIFINGLLRINKLGSKVGRYVRICYLQGFAKELDILPEVSPIRTPLRQNICSAK